MAATWIGSWWVGTAADKSALDVRTLGKGMRYFETDTDTTYVWTGSQWLTLAAGGVTDHGALTGLDDPDHNVPYAQKSVAASISGDWNFNPGELGLPSGTSFPGSPGEGDIYYRSDEDKLYIYTTTWVEVGAGAGGGGAGLGAIYWHVPGAVGAATEVGEARILPHGVSFLKAYIYCKTPGSAGTTICDIHKNGVTIFTTQANRPSLAWDDPDKKDVSGVPDVTTGVEGDIMTHDVDQAATNAAELMVVLCLDIDRFDDTEGDPENLDIPEADGTSEFAARRDHKHRSQLDSGTSFPGSPAEGDIFYRTDEDRVYTYDGAAWNELGAGGGAWTLIADVELGAPAANIDFQNIPGTYKHLAIFFSLRTDRAGFGSDLVYLRFNNSSTGYDWFRGTIKHPNALETAEALNDSEIEMGTIATAATAPAGGFGQGRIYCEDYADTSKLAGIEQFGGLLLSRVATGIRNSFTYGEWRTAAVVTRITLIPGLGSNFVTGSRASLYGIS